MLFSERFEVEPGKMVEFGAYNISLVCDIPLFIDPLLIFNSSNPNYKNLHKEIIKYFYFLSEKSKSSLEIHEVMYWFTFHEVSQNWLGYCIEGNKGRALGKDFANHLYDNISFVLNNHGISKGKHIEKIMLIQEGNGRDKISDLTVNLIKEYLLEYTQEFAEKNIDQKYLKQIPVDKAYFNYKTETFVSKYYNLPYIENEKGETEYVLLTPVDLLRKKEPSINRDDFLNNDIQIRESISNGSLRAMVNNYINKAVREYELQQKKAKKQVRESQIRKIEKDAFEELTHQHLELYDYYILLKEKKQVEIRRQCTNEVKDTTSLFIYNSKRLVDRFKEIYPNYIQKNNSFEESKKKIIFFKHIIEDCDGYKNLYLKGERISTENDLQRFFKLAWENTRYDVNFEVNNGRGAADTIVSFGRADKCIIEFKLASNARLKHVFKQTEVYEKANETKKRIVVIFYFTADEKKKTLKILKDVGYDKELDNWIILIDCRNDNKRSASKAV